jgi:hypothetical protein
MVIAALMHDIVKYANDTDKYTSKTHALDAAAMLKSAGLNDEARLVASHMGRWDKNAPHPQKEDEKMLHLADFLASRQWITIDFDDDENIIKNNNTLPSRRDYEDTIALKQDELDMWSGKKEIPF